jgi:hypothetical protein
MTRPDLAFAYSQLCKFVQYPAVVHLQAAERVLQYVRGTYYQEITYCDRLFDVLEWRRYFLEIIPTSRSYLSRREAEFVAASQAGQEVVYLRELLNGFGHPQKKPTEIWEDNASCIMMSENPTNRDRSRHVDVKVHYLRDLVRDGHVKLVNVQVLRMFRTL